MARSLRRLADCIGLKGEFEVVRDFFGYATGAPGQLSLLDQMKLLRQYHVNVNVILVGAEWFGDDELSEVDGAVAFMRNAFATVNFGVGRIRWYHITTDEANGREHIVNDAEAEDLTHEWTVDNYAMDVFFVLTYAGSSIGTAPRKGPTNKNANGPMTGVVLAIEGSPAVTGNVLAREVARYLGLKDSENSNNLMYPWVPNGGHLTREQGEDLIGPGHYLGPFVVLGCREYIVRWA
jgi:hypothetical protein